MHGSTREMVEHLTGALVRQGVDVIPFNLIHTDIGELAKELVDASTVVLASPTVLGGAHPAVAHAAFLVNALRPKLKFASIIGSYGWGGRTVENLLASLGNLKVELLEPVLAKGCPQGKGLPGPGPAGRGHRRQAPGHRRPALSVRPLPLHWLRDGVTMNRV